MEDEHYCQEEEIDGSVGKSDVDAMLNYQMMPNSSTSYPRSYPIGGLEGGVGPDSDTAGQVRELIIPSPLTDG